MIESIYYNTNNLIKINKKKLPGELNPSQLKSSFKNVDISYPFNGQYRPILCKYIYQVIIF